MFYYERKRGNGMEQFSLKTEIIIGGADLKRTVKRHTEGIYRDRRLYG